MLELKYVVTNFKIYWIFYWLMKQNIKNIFVRLDGTQSELQNTIYRIHLSHYAAKLLVLVWCERMSRDENPIEIPIFHHIGNFFVLY